ncbi:energy-coupling factor transporter transmembrane protein EcfT [Xinfangfangia sp. D13-10-4-6]|uniref:energy-coupling factor transporter transmembrane component T family protein n=1 Tax=Pseudogemmobacter hezensis TaxID=2737662 RepID=UPI0015561DE8|nr:energy-coupling factor transporter transmembrane component T [Pseudogemmobacter hezensis]NPD13607.1 energy-coupling factor transporter transmembrane protein EcfT [Pseudogemmobacter hezensis]
MLTLTSPVKTPFHRLPAGLKMALMMGFGIAVMWAQSPGPLLVAAAVVIMLYLFCGPAVMRLALRALLSLWPFLGMLLIWGWWDGRMAQATLVSLRLGVMVAAANLVTMTTPLSEMLVVFETLARPFSRFIPPRRLALAFALVIRFVPEMGTTLQRLRDAWRARSRRRPGWRIVVPVLLSALDNADHTAEALRARGGVDGIGNADAKKPQPLPAEKA